MTIRRTDDKRKGGIDDLLPCVKRVSRLKIGRLHPHGSRGESELKAAQNQF